MRLSVPVLLSEEEGKAIEDEVAPGCSETIYKTQEAGRSCEGYAYGNRRFDEIEPMRSDGYKYIQVHR